MPLKIDLHVHTRYSSDSSITPKDLVIQARMKGLNGIAVTDHDTIEGAMKIVRMIESPRGDNRLGNLIAIPGIEVSTRQGHLLGLNVTMSIPRGLDVEEAIERIHDAGGVAVAAHPWILFKRGIGLDSKILSYGLDAIEVMNSSAFPFWLSARKCREFARRHNLPQTAGSDSHIPETIGLAYTIISECETKIESLMESIRKGLTKPAGRGMPLSLRVKRALDALRGVS
ncbi:MAG: CehA/McbA family metallohydrolase [Candidatus Bathyarchaeia archaeon]|nr:CehA/McbA family metallohydrolase [Candidatus Bathyarchaeota archaeon]